MDERRPIIIDVIKGDPQLQNIIAELKQKKFLVRGVSRPEAYRRDTDRIESAWQEDKKSRINAVAVGVSRYYDLCHCKVLRSHAQGRAKDLLRRWKTELRKEFPSDHEAIDDVCSKIGQYLEYMNRMSQAF